MFSTSGTRGHGAHAALSHAERRDRERRVADGDGRTMSDRAPAFGCSRATPWSSVMIETRLALALRHRVVDVPSVTEVFGIGLFAGRR